MYLSSGTMAAAPLTRQYNKVLSIFHLTSDSPPLFPTSHVLDLHICTQLCQKLPSNLTQSLYTCSKFPGFPYLLNFCLFSKPLQNGCITFRPGNQDKLCKGLVCASPPVGFEETKNNRDNCTGTVSSVNTESALRKLGSIFSPWPYRKLF